MDALIKKLRNKEITLAEYKKMNGCAEIMKIMLEKNLSKDIASEYYKIRRQRNFLSLLLESIEEECKGDGK